MHEDLTRDRALEVFLAAIYASPEVRSSFLADPVGEALRAGVAEADATALARVDRVGLDLLAESMARKRRHRDQHRGDYPLGH